MFNFDRFNDDAFRYYDHRRNHDSSLDTLEWEVFDDGDIEAEDDIELSDTDVDHISSS